MIVVVPLVLALLRRIRRLRNRPEGHGLVARRAGSQVEAAGKSTGWTVPTLEHRVFVGSVAVGLLHAIDDAVINRQPGVPVAQHLTGLIAVTVVGIAAAVLFTRLRPGLRAGLALVAGAVTVTNGAMHVAHVVAARSTASDLTGILAAMSGLVLITLGITIPLTHRGEASSTPSRRWVNRAAAVGLGAAVAQFVVVPLGVGLVQTHQYRRDVGAPPSSAFRNVSFDSSDGLTLAGWYHSSRNRAAVVIANSARGDRRGSLRHAEMLAYDPVPGLQAGCVWPAQLARGRRCR